MPIEDVFSITGRGTVVTGRVERGRLKVHEEVEIVGLRPKSFKRMVEGIEMSRKLLDEAQAGCPIGVLLGRTEKDEVERGMVLARPGTIAPYTKFKAWAYMLTEEEGGRHTPFFNGYRPQFYFRTTAITGVVTVTQSLGGTEVRPGEEAYLEIELIAPIAMEKGLRFAIREGEHTVGTGTVIEMVQ